MARTRSRTPAAYAARARRDFNLARELVAQARRYRALKLDDLAANCVILARSYNRSGVFYARTASAARRTARIRRPFGF